MTLLFQPQLPQQQQIIPVPSGGMRPYGQQPLMSPTHQQPPQSPYNLPQQGNKLLVSFL